MSRLLLSWFTLLALSATAAAQERITVYSAGPASLIDRLAKGFAKKTAITADVFQATTGKVMARIEAEASNPKVDVVISASWDTAADFARRGWLAPVQSANGAKVPAFLKSDVAIAQGVSALAIAWNPKSRNSAAIRLG